MSLPSEVAGATTRSAVSGEKKKGRNAALPCWRASLRDDSRRIPERILAAGVILAQKRTEESHADGLRKGSEKSSSALTPPHIACFVVCAPAGVGLTVAP